MIIGLTHVKVDALYLLSGSHSDEFPLHFIKPPLGSLQRHAAHELAEAVVIALNSAAIKVVQGHLIVVLRK